MPGNYFIIPRATFPMPLCGCNATVPAYPPAMPRPLTILLLQTEAAAFARVESTYPEPSLFGATDGKAVGTYLEQKFQAHLQTKYEYVRGNSASGIDFPGLEVDIKVTSIRQPQSSCPFRSASQKIYGLGYSLLIFVYEKHDDAKTRTARLDIQHVVFVEMERTADYQTTTGLRRLLENNANRDDILAFFEERFMPFEDEESICLAGRILREPPELGYLSASPERIRPPMFNRVMENADQIPGLLHLN